jgi:hypothetical protein
MSDDWGSREGIQVIPKGCAKHGLDVASRSDAAVATKPQHHTHFTNRMGTSKSTMTHPNHDGNDARDASLLTSPTRAGSDASDPGFDDNDALKTEMKLLWAERENIDLKLKLRGVESEVRGLKAKVRDLEAALSARASTVSDAVDFSPTASRASEGHGREGA